MSYDEIRMELKQPMDSVSTPSTSYSRPESENPTDQLIWLPEDGDTKSADPESWVKDKDFQKHPKVKKTPLMALPALGVKVFEVEISSGQDILNYVDNNKIPIGEILG